ncbi:MAG: VWA domain-containing protein [Candidatus Hydrogenedentes bacterium]|nr:VWA domain-containing protein [Candidatus Hydrogenedentota bacterium]
MSYLQAPFQSLGNFISASFLTPIFLWFLTLIPVVVLLYLLKLRRTEVLISSTLLWRKSLQDLTANAPFQRLRKNLLLFLQILVLLLLACGLGRPFIKAEGLAGANLCLLIDRSASMQTKEGTQTRLDTAKQQALEMINSMRGGDKMMLVPFGAKSEVLCELTDDRVRLRQAVNAISAADTGTKIRDAVSVARSLKLSVPDLTVVIISDGRIADLDELGRRDLEVNFLQVGESANNAGITAFSLREPQEGRGERQSFVLVHNENSEPLKTTLTLYFDEDVLAVEEVAAPPGGDREVVFAHPSLDEGVLRAELDHDDALPADNRAWLAVRPSASLKVLLVAEGGATGAYFLQRVLALDSRVELSTLAPASYVETGGYDLTIFDGFAPPTLPLGSQVYINVAPPLPGVRFEGTFDNPPVVSKDPEHFLMRFLNPANLGITKAQKLIAPPDSRALISTTGGPLVADVSRGGQQIAVIAFDLADSNWPLHLSFPLFVQNLLAWIPRGAMAQESSIPAGSALTIMPDPEHTDATVTLPDGTKQSVALSPLRPTFFGATERAGVYTVTRSAKEPGAAGESFAYAVNLADRNESSVTPASNLTLGRGEVQGQRGTIKQNRELWRWLVLIAVLILTLEWWVYSRRAWV